MDAVEQKRNCNMADGMGASETWRGTRHRAMGDAADNSDVVPATQKKRCRAADLRVASVEIEGKGEGGC